MAFPNRGAAAPALATAAPAAPTPPMAPAPPAAPQPPMAPQPPAAPAAPAAPPAAERTFWVNVNGSVQPMTESQVRALPPVTQIMTQDQSSGWQPASVLLGAAAAPAGAPAGAPAVGTRQSFARTTPAATGAPVGGTGAPRGLFSAVESAEVIRRGQNLHEGDYIARLCKAEFKPGRQGNYVILEMEIVTSSFDANDPTKQQCNVEGSRATVFIKQNDSFASNMKEVMIALSGFDDKGESRDVHDKVTQAECDALISAEQPYTNAMVYLEARAIKTRAGGDFTRISWWPCPLNADGSPNIEKLMREIR